MRYFRGPIKTGVSCVFMILWFLLSLSIHHFPFLTRVATTQLNKTCEEITPHDIPLMFQSAKLLLQLVSTLYGILNLVSCSFYVFIGQEDRGLK